jgi:cell division protein DivIC
MSRGKKISAKVKRRLVILTPVCLISIIYFLFSLSYYGYNIYTLKNKKVELENQYNELLSEAEQLNLEIEKLNDPDYLARYARENYSYSKDGEYIIKISSDASDTKEEINSIDKIIDESYIFFGSLIIILLIFILLIRKMFKKNK